MPVSYLTRSTVINITSKSTKPQLREYIALLNSQLIAQAKELEHLRMQLSIAQATPKAQSPGSVTRRYMKQGELWEKVLIDPQRRIYTNRRVSA